SRHGRQCRAQPKTTRTIGSQNRRTEGSEVMTAITGGQLSTEVLVALTKAAVRVLALAGVAGLGLAGFRVKTTSGRLLTWTIVLYAALAMPLLQQMLPPLTIPAPVFSESKRISPAAEAPKVSPREMAASLGLNVESAAHATSTAPRPAPSTELEWRTL